MPKMGKFSTKDLKKLQKSLNELQGEKTNAFVEECAKELAARLLAKVIKRTPVGNYAREVTEKKVAKKTTKNHKKGETYVITKKVNPSGKKGGTLRRGWTAGQSVGSGGAKAYADSLQINHVGDLIQIEIINPVEYASYVEYGHRTANHEGWVQGRFMLTISEQEIQSIAPKVLESKIKKFLGECMK